MNKITIIGSGSVGSTIAYTLTVQGIASEIVMIDINEEKAKGEALDIRQGVPFCTPCSVYAGSYEDAKDSDIVIITSGIARKARPDQTGPCTDERQHHQEHHAEHHEVRTGCNLSVRQQPG